MRIRTPTITARNMDSPRSTSRTTLSLATTTSFLSTNCSTPATGWSRAGAISGIARFATGLPVTFASFGDNALMDVQNNGVNGISIDMPDVVPGNLEINHNPRNGRPYFNTSLFSPNALSTQGDASRRSFYGPGMDNFDMALHKVTKFTESQTLEIRFELFNALNHAQFFS